MANRQATAPRFVSYYRVSTRRQARSGLGMEAQREAVAAHVAGVGGALVAEFTETESGGRNDRPMLADALAACRVYGAALLVAKLDRLSRNVAFLAALMDSGAEFVACDLPEANRLTLHLMAAMAEHERDAISERTKAALAAAKARGIKLGRPQNLTPEGRALGSKNGNERQRERAAARAADLLPTIRELQEHGTVTLRGLAAALNEMGVPAPRGGRWHASSVRNALALAGEATAD